MKLSRIIIITAASSAIAAPVPKADASPGYSNYGLSSDATEEQQIC